MVDHKLRKYSDNAESVVGLRETPLRCQECPFGLRKELMRLYHFSILGLTTLDQCISRSFNKTLTKNQLGQVTFAKLKVLASPTLVADLTIDAITEHLVAHYRLKTIKIAEHFKFFECSQKKKEKQQWTL